MAKVNNDAVDLDINVTLNWFQLGWQFAELSDDDQFQFLASFSLAIEEWSTHSRLAQFDSIVSKFTEHRSDLKPQLAKAFQDLADRFKADV